MQSVADLLAERAGALPQRRFLTWAPFDGEGRHWTYSEFRDDVARVAGGLLAKGVRKGDRVLVLSENCPEVLLAYFACAWMGAVCVPVNAASTSVELAYFLERTGAVGVVVQDTLKGVVSPAQAETRSPWVVTTETFHTLRAAPVPRADLAPGDVASILFTSGTTSRPKGVVWTQANVLWGARMGAQQEGLREDDVHLVFLPLFHVVALTWSILPVMWVGASAVLQPRFSASRFWDAALAHRCTWASMVPFCTAVLARQPVPDKHGFRTWGHAVYNPDHEKRFGVKLLGWWGMTEVITQGIVADADHPQVPGTIGRPSKGYDILVLDDSGRPAKPGEVGELRIRGERGVALFREYLDDPEATAASFDESGYFRTGDRVIARADGAIQFVDRAKDVIKVGGENVAAPEVERVIASVPGVREVAVVGKGDPVMGEVAVAFVLADEPRRNAAFAEELLAACRAQLAKFKVPREVHFVEDFPRVSIGKVSKVELRKRLALSLKGEGDRS